MQKNLKDKLFMIKNRILLEKYFYDGKLIPFEEELYSKLNEVYFNSIPMTFHLKYLKPGPNQVGQCYDRSLWLTMGLDDAILVRGSRKDLEILYGKDHDGHGWVEKNGYVYDPTMLCKIKKELYYKVFGVTDVVYITKEEYSDDKWYQNIINTKIEDFLPGGLKRCDLATTIPLVESIAEMTNNSEFKELLDEYLKKIKYDYSHVTKELYDTVNKLILEQGLERAI